MHTYTALYENRADAEAVQNQLKTLGILDADGASVYDKQNAAGAYGAAKSVSPPNEDRQVFDEHLRQGGFMLTVNVDDTEADQVRDLLERSPAVDVDEREQQLRSAGAFPAARPSTTQASAAPLAQTRTTDRTATEGEQSIPIVEEALRIGKRSVERGGVRVRAYTVETPIQEQVTLREEHVDIERHRVDQPLGAVGADAFQERTIELTETAEEAVVAKEARVVEELTVRKDVTEHAETIEDTLRHTEVDVERLPGSTQTRPLNR
jgi:uncharacterized protein (TIGR02271 family)